MVATYTYRSGAAPTAVNAEAEITREVNLATANRLTAGGVGKNKIRELRMALGWSVDTNADEYFGLATLGGKGIQGAPQEFVIAGFGGSTQTITYAPIIMPATPRKVDVAFTKQGDVSFNFVQDGDSVATGENSLGIKYD